MTDVAAVVCTWNRPGALTLALESLAGQTMSRDRYQVVVVDNGDGTLTVIHEDSPDRYRVVQTVETMDGARTMTLDPVSHTIYTVSARFGQLSAGAGRRRPPVLPGTFTLLVVAP